MALHLTLQLHGVVHDMWYLAAVIIPESHVRPSINTITLLHTPPVVSLIMVVNMTADREITKRKISGLSLQTAPVHRSGL
jgi:hypothetical protein